VITHDGMAPNDAKISIVFQRFGMLSRHGLPGIPSAIVHALVMTA
jgi:hypothetical protein